ncbi:signal peptidase II [Ruixingdingia sedimenti]|uniref:Lipoprotein signal peptidase n=1 Tax=Ruixingdingia sedimenti TaxID=3073604 RepID=A0ABU1F7K5_9RHOB|nr:signal peptidase II [Xinfangfangia sp. LG-4]MDR5652588.1 signal peptidase II [Xinfangfangia sp. LG-4]
MRRLWLTAIAAFALDQASKLAVIHLVRLPLRGEVDVIDPLLNLRWAENRGINFGLFAHDANAARWVLIALALAISAWVVHWARRERQNRWTQISAGLLVGGALGNVVDRLAYGYVADFLNMSCCGIENPYAFNVADVAIAAGAMGLVLFSGGSGKAPARKPRRKTP